MSKNKNKATTIGKLVRQEDQEGKHPKPHLFFLKFRVIDLIFVFQALKKR